MWKDCLRGKEPFDNVTLIFPTQQQDVSALVQTLHDNVNVQKVVVFGSSVTSACNPWSDIDLYVELKTEEQLRLPRVGTEVDLWTNFDVDDRLMQEIDEKGVCVYKRASTLRAITF